MRVRTKGIILAGGNGSRLYPLTKCISKQLLPVYDKPMIYYPLSILMEANIMDILIISTRRDLQGFKNIFGDGSKIGLKISYAVQSKPNGIAEAFVIGAKFIGSSNVCLILGDNIFYGKGFTKFLDDAIKNLNSNFSTIFGIQVENPKAFGVIEFSNKNKINRIVEKPSKTESNCIVTGLYFYTNDVIKISKDLKPSARGELEITDVNNHYLKSDKLKLIKLNSSYFWSDTGTYDSLIKASEFCKEFEDITGNKLSCIEEIALKKGFITKNRFMDIANSMISSDYGKYLLNKIKD